MFPPDAENVHKPRIKISLVLHVVDGEDRGGGTHVPVMTVKGVHEHRNRSRVPVVSMDQVRGKIEHFTKFQGGSGEEDEPVVVIHEPFISGAIDAIPAIEGFIFQKIDRHRGVGQPSFVDATVHRADDSHRDDEGAGEEFQSMVLRIDGVIAGKNHPDIVSSRFQGAGQGAGHIAQPPFLDKGSCFGDGKKDGKRLFHRGAFG